MTAKNELTSLDSFSFKNNANNISIYDSSHTIIEINIKNNNCFINHIYFTEEYGHYSKKINYDSLEDMLVYWRNLLWELININYRGSQSKKDSKYTFEFHKF